MKITDEMRIKYAKRERGASMVFAYPPGGADVHRLCDDIDRLQHVIEEAQCELEIAKVNPVVQTKIHGMLFAVQNK